MLSPGSPSNNGSKGSGAVNDIVVVSREWAYKLLRPQTWYSMSLGLKRLQELIQGTSSLNDDPVWLLGLWYGLQDADTNSSSMTPELHQLLLDDLNSRFWFTYRRDFPPLGGSSLTSDVGWGCTLRSGQMFMAEAISRCWWGRGVKFAADGGSTDASVGTSAAPQQHMHQADQQQQHGAGAAGVHQRAGLTGGGGGGGSGGSSSTGGSSSGGGSSRSRSNSPQGGPDQVSLLRLFADEPGPQAPFSIHNLCAAGAPHGVVAGQWLGPWVLCKALAAAAAAAAQHAQQQHTLCLGLHVQVACDPGGGAPELNPVQLRQLLSAGASSSNNIAANVSSTGGQQQEQQHQQQQQQQELPQQQELAQQQQQQGLLLLVPLTLGVGKANERYLPQLTAALSFPQSVGIVGGRPGASLYFVGVQGGSVLYLDPHEVQEAPVLPRDVASFHCSLPRLMPLTAIDPSLAIGFFCANTADLDDLLSRLQDLAASAGGAPLMTVQQPGRVSSTAADAVGAAGDNEVDAAPGGRADDWELV